ncbi:MAG: hypothetical protein FGM23_05985 [Alphaproteobacteria bacterium]|nr:hypothetical protein [Alphaproteobacteria bacterium]
MPQSKSLFNGKVGDGGQKSGRAVSDLHDLITAAGIGYAPAQRDKWQPETLSVIKAFRQACIDSGNAKFLDKLHAELNKNCIEPNDSTAFNLAYQANILIEMPCACGIGGIIRLNDWFSKNQILYQTGADKSLGDRATYKLSGFSGWAIQSIARRWQSGPVKMDCTTYVNLAMGVYFSGEAAGKYDASTPFGGTSQNKIAYRYDFKSLERSSIDLQSGKKIPSEITSFSDLMEIVNNFDQNGLYIVECAKMDGFVTHMALLHRGMIWEYNIMKPKNGTQFFNRPIEAFAPFSKGPKKKFFIYGL